MWTECLLVTKFYAANPCFIKIDIIAVVTTSNRSNTISHICAEDRNIHIRTSPQFMLPPEFVVTRTFRFWNGLLHPNIGCCALRLNEEMRTPRRETNGIVRCQIVRNIKHGICDMILRLVRIVVVKRLIVLRQIFMTYTERQPRACVKTPRFFQIEAISFVIAAIVFCCIVLVVVPVD